VLVQLEGQTLLTDPIFASRASPLSFAGPKRVVPPALTVAELPDDLSGVLISHNHYDHLCLSSVRELHARYGSQLRWYVPLGVAAWFTKTLGITAPHVAELDWWEEAEHAPGVRVVLTPAQHWSTRGLFDRFATLWGSWAVLGTSLRFFFTGDTGYSQIFTQIGERLGPFDLAAIPTGAYEPRNFMKPQHVNPEEAVQLHIELQSRRSMAIHLGTFALTDESMDEPVTLLVKEAADAGLASDEFITLRHGATLATAAGKDVFAPARLAFPSAAASSAPKID
jgi:N-acyl-phosphatidylethanolamine-hydrolysing phospholipase D